MELKEAIEKIEKTIYKDKDKKEYWHYIDICYDEMYEFAEAIERVLEELDRLDTQIYIMKDDIRTAYKKKYKQYPFIANILSEIYEKWSIE